MQICVGCYYTPYGNVKSPLKCKLTVPWWRHEMEKFSALLALCAGNAPVTVELSSQRPVTRSFDVFFDLRMNKWLSKQSWGWWFEMPSCPLWRHCNSLFYHYIESHMSFMTTQITFQFSRTHSLKQNQARCRKWLYSPIQDENNWHQ